MQKLLRALKIAVVVFGGIVAMQLGAYYAVGWLLRQPTWVSLSVVGGTLFVAFTFYIWTLIDAKMI